MEVEKSSETSRADETEAVEDVVRDKDLEKVRYVLITPSKIHPIYMHLARGKKNFVVNTQRVH